MEDVKQLEFLAEKSKEIIEKQVGSFRQQHTYAGTILGVSALFIPFFLSGLRESNIVIHLISIIPIVLFFGGMLLLLNIFRTKSLDQAFIIEKYDALLKKSYMETLVFIIETNTRSFHLNKIIAQRANKKYNLGIRFITIAMLLAILLLLVNLFTKIETNTLKAPLSIIHENSFFFFHSQWQ